MKTEYIAEIKRLIEENYEPVLSPLDAEEFTEKKSLKEVHQMLTNILPSDWVYESDVYNILQELGFKNFLHTFPEKEAGDIIIPAKTTLVYFLNKKTAAL